jgi:hypothetical protein
VGARHSKMLAGPGGQKAPSNMGKLSIAEVLRLRATSSVSRGKSVRRSAQDDDFVGVSKASGRAHLPSFIHPTRKLVVMRLQPADRSNLILFSDALLKAGNRLHRQKVPCSANLDSSATTSNMGKEK